MTLPMTCLNTDTKSVSNLLKIAKKMGYRIKAVSFINSHRPRILTKTGE